MKPPISPYGTLTGQLFLYAGNRAAFESPINARLELSSSSSGLCPNKCVLLGGLSDGLLPTPYTQLLEQACCATNAAHSWSLVQPLLSSSYTGFGHGSLDRDTTELHELFEYLATHRNCQRLVIVGHSTGCQNIVHYLKKKQHDTTPNIVAVILQAPVSDREHAMANQDEYNRHLAMAVSMAANKNHQELMPRSAFWAPITAQRFLDLHERGGADDFFSSDYSDAELADRLGHIGAASSYLRTCLVAFSGADEFVPDTVDSHELMERLVRAMNGHHKTPPVAEGLYLATANHSLSQTTNDANIFVNRVAEILATCLN
jgi:pimeloyl-ACP methyl ester carboxylesterase